MKWREREGSTCSRDRRTKARRLRKQREIGADALLRLPIKRRQIITHQCQWLAAETTAVRDARLQQVSACQREIDSWDYHWKRHQITVNERQTGSWEHWRDARLECDKARHGEQQTVHSQLPLFQQCFSQAKMDKFHLNTGYGYIGYISSYALTAQKGFPASCFSQSLLNVCVVVVTNILQKYTPLLTTWTLTLGHIPPQLHAD